MGAIAMVSLLGVALGVVLVAGGWRGRQVGSEPRCGLCRYDLTWLLREMVDPDSPYPVQCPECGGTITGVGGLRYGQRRRHTPLLVCGAVMLVLTTPMFLGGAMAFSGSASLLRRLPTGVLLELAKHDSDLNGWARQREVRRRAEVGAMSAADATAVADAVLRAQRDPEAPWGLWGSVFERLVDSKATTAAHDRAFHEGVWRVSLRTREEVEAGQPLPLEVVCEWRGADGLFTRNGGMIPLRAGPRERSAPALLLEDGEATVRDGASVGLPRVVLSRWVQTPVDERVRAFTATIGWMPESGLLPPAPVRAPAEPGEYEVRVRGTLRLGEPGDFWSEAMEAAGVSGEWPVEVAATVRVIPPRRQTAKAAPASERAGTTHPMRRGAWFVAASENGGVRFGSFAFRKRGVVQELAPDLYARATVVTEDGAEHPMGEFVARADIDGGAVTLPIDPALAERLLQGSGRVVVRVEPDPSLAQRVVNPGSVWSGEAWISPLFVYDHRPGH